MPRVKYTEKKSGGRDSETTGPRGTGDLGASARRGGCGPGDRDPEEEGELGGSEVVGESSEASGK